MKARITVDGQHSLMTHQTNTSEDNVHFAPAGGPMQGLHAAVVSAIDSASYTGSLLQ